VLCRDVSGIDLVAKIQAQLVEEQRLTPLIKII
jgi:hypothetical protein